MDTYSYANLNYRTERPMRIIDGYIWHEMRSDTQLVPLGHETLLNHYRVPIYYQPPETYTIYVGKDMSRIYTTDTLPDYVKVKITMANAHGEPLVGDSFVYSPMDVFDSSRYIPPEMLDVAWRVSPSMYVVVLERVELFKMRGEA